MKSIKEQKKFYKNNCNYVWYYTNHEPTEEEKDFLCNFFKIKIADKINSKPFLEFSKWLWGDNEERYVKEIWLARISAKDDSYINTSKLPDTMPSGKLEYRLCQLGTTADLDDEFKRFDTDSEKVFKGKGQFRSAYDREHYRIKKI